MSRINFWILFVITLFAFSFFGWIATSHGTLGTTLPVDYPEAIPQKGPYLSEVTSNSIIISWRTVNPYSSVILYGLTLLYGYEGKDTNPATVHNLKIINLMRLAVTSMPMG